MEKNTKIIIGVIVVLFVAGLFVQGQITGKAITCNIVPDITSVQAKGNTVSLNWKDVSDFAGQARYEVRIFKQMADGSYDLSNPLKVDNSKAPNYAFVDLKEGTYIAQIRARTSRCVTDYSEYVTSDAVTTITE